MKISPSITKAVGRSLLQVQKHSPLILTIVGVAGLVTAGVLAAKATLKLEETVDKGADHLKWTKEAIGIGDKPETALTNAYVENTIELAKLYWVPLTLAGGSIICILSGQHILSQRNAALVVAYKGLETAFNNYRARVVEQYGEEVDQDFRFGLRSVEGKDENGKKVTTKELDRTSTSEYLFDFGPGNPNWVGNYEHNLFFLTGHQNIMNDMLRSRGHVFLSEVLDALAIPRTPASIVTGWLWDPKQEIDNVPRDNWINFGIKDLWESNGYILLDFNVDGTIYDKI